MCSPLLKISAPLHDNNMKTDKITQQDYCSAFAIGKGSETDSEEVINKAEKALEKALDTRKFEISLYWERAKYFWTFIAAALASFAIALRFQDHNENPLVLLIICCLGIIFSFAWFLVNKGSKRWQENWENHVSMLEDETIGPLFKTILARNPIEESKGQKLKSFLIGPGEYSVSKINQIVSIYVFVIWIFLLIYVVFYYWALKYFFIFLLPAGATACTIYALCKWGESNSDNHGHTGYQYTSKIKE